MKTKPCTCAAYDYPHRLDSGLCRDFYNHKDILDDYKADIARDFMREEVDAYNQERSIFEQVRFT